MANPQILIVDDDLEFRNLLADFLTARGFTVATASDGEEAVQVAKEILPPLILMDVQMPKKDGIAATFDLQQDPKTKDIKVIFLTNLGDSSPFAQGINRSVSRQIGALDYVKKSSDFDQILTRIKNALQVK